MEETIFYLLAGLLTLMSLLVVTVRNLLHAAVCLIASFFATAAIYILLRMEFVALAQIMIYIGGIVIFMVITILLTAQLGGGNLFPKTPLQRLWGAGVALALLVVMLWAGSGFDLAPEKNMPLRTPASLDAVGRRLLAQDATGFLVPFEAVSILLVTALIGAVVIARREPGPATTKETSA